MRPIVYSLCLATAAWLAAPAAAADEGLSRADLSQIGKAATVFIENSHGSGSGFCVHPSGLFVTNEHVVAGFDTVTVVLDSGLKTQKVVKARVVRADKELDLALVRADGVKDLPALPLGSVEKITETMEIVAFGFPFGKMLGADLKEYPAVSVNVGSVTSLREKAGALHRIQVDAALNPGNSGGPVLGRDGKVIGVVVAGVRGAGVNFVIPVSHVSSFLARPDLAFQPPELTRASINAPVEFRAQVTSVVPGGKPLSLELVLTAEDGKDRTYPMVKDDDGYHVKATPVPPPDGPAKLRGAFTYANGMVTGRIADRTLTIDGKPYKLSELRGLRWQPAVTAVAADGKALEGTVAGLDGIEVDLGKEFVKLKLDGAISAQFERVGAAGSVTCAVVVKQDDKEVARLSRTLSVTDPVADLPRDPGFGEAKIQPPALDQDKIVRMLPASLDALAVGGGGRYLILHLPKVRKLAVFDANEAKVVKYIDLAEDNVKFTAGQDKLLIGLPGAKVVQRWSLTTFTREAVFPSPVKDDLRFMLMGSAGAGPALINGEFVDIQTMKALPLKYPGDRPLNTADDQRWRASADGKTFGAWQPDSSPQMQRIDVLVGDEVKEYPVGQIEGHVNPGPDGRFVFTGGGVFSPDGHPAGGDNLKGKHYCIPAQRGGWYVTVRIFEQPAGPADKREGVTLFLSGIGQAVVNVPEVALWDGVNGWDREAIPLEQRIHLIPDAKLIVTIPPSNDSLVLHRFDAEAALAKSDLNYLFVSSQPLTTAKRGQAYSYPLAVKSKKGGLKYKLESGPDGMKVSTDGRVTWDVPADWKGGADVLISIGDAGGQECFHSYKIAVSE